MADHLVGKKNIMTAGVSGGSRERAAVCLLGCMMLTTACRVDDTGIGAGTAPPAVGRPPDAGRTGTGGRGATTGGATGSGTGGSSSTGAGGTTDAGALDGASVALDVSPGDADHETIPPAPPAADAASDTAGPRPTSVGGGSECPQSDELALCLRFEGAATDESRNRLAVLDAPTVYLPAPGGRAIDVRPGGRMRIAETPVLDSDVLTLEVVVNLRDSGRRMTIVENFGQYGLYVLPSGSLMCTGGGTYALLTEGITRGRWTRVTCVIDGREIALFVDDGRSRIVPVLTPLTTDRNRGLWIGYEDVPDRDLDGQIDELRIWRAVRRP